MVKELIHDIQYTKEFFKLVSSLDKDWNGSKRSKENIISYIHKNQEHIDEYYIEEALACISKYDEIRLHFLRYLLINEILIDENKEKRQYFVYKHTVPNGKVYIGITCSIDVDFRWRDGFGYTKNKPFYSDIEKYGWDNIKHEILYNGLSPVEAQRVERSLIKEYNSIDPQYGYNLDDGGIIHTSPYTWESWRYDITYQLFTRRRPFKLIVSSEENSAFLRYINKYNIDVIKNDLIVGSDDLYFVVAGNPSYKEINIREIVDDFLQKYEVDLQVEFAYGVADGDAFEFDSESKKLKVKLYLINKPKYKFENVIQDLKVILENIKSILVEGINND